MNGLCSVMVRGNHRRTIVGLPLGYHYPGEMGIGVAVTAVYSRRGWRVIGAVPVTRGCLVHSRPPEDEEAIGWAAVACWGLAIDGGSPSGWSAIGAPIDMLGRGDCDIDGEGGLPDAEGLRAACTEAVVRVYHRRREWAPSWIKEDDWRSLEKFYGLQNEQSDDPAGGDDDDRAA